MATPQPAILTNLATHQWYVHLSRAEGADLAVIKAALRDLRTACEADGVNVCVLFGPTLLKDLTTTCPTTSSPTRDTSPPMARWRRARRRSC